MITSNFAAVRAALTTTILSLVFLAPCMARADEAEPDERAGQSPPQADTGRTPRPLQGATAARLIDGGKAQYPGEALRRFREGWVDVSFVVRADGSVGDPVVEDSSGTPALEKAALKAVVQSRYYPATVDGEPVEQCVATMRYMFVITDLPMGARRSFITEFKRAESALKSGNLAAARTIADDLAQHHTTNLYEGARRWVLEAQVREAEGDKPGALEAVERALSHGDKHMEPGLYRDLVVRAFWRSIELQQWGRALTMEERLAKLAEKNGEAPVDPAVIRAATEIRTAIAGDDVLGFPGTVSCRGGCADGRPNWQHELLRREFAFDLVDGDVDDFELRCDWRRIRGAVNTEQAWKVPGDWGWCQLFVFGQEGARLKVVEYPLEPAMSPAAWIATPLASSSATAPGTAR